MLENSTPLPLADATYEVLRLLGPDVLLDTGTFLGALLDFADGDSPEVRMLGRNLDDFIMEPIAAMLQTEEILEERKLSEACVRASLLLAKERSVDQRVAEASIGHIADGIRRYLGMSDAPPPPPPPPPTPPFNWRVVLAGAAAVLVVAVVLVFTVFRAKVTFDGNGAQGSTRAVSAFKGHELALPDSTFEYDGYSFAGWAKAPGEIAAYQPDDTFTVNEDTTLYATWLPHVSFDANGADSGEVESMLVPASGVLTLPKNGYARQGYKFGGWSLKADGLDAVKSKTDVEVSEPTTYYAAWKPIASFRGNGTKEGSTDDVVASIDGAMVLPECAFVRAGYAFDGWSLNKSGKDAVAAGEKATISGPTTYYATWKAMASFKGNGATEGETKAVVEDGEGVATLPDCGFKRNGCVFLGWYQAGEEFAKNPYYEIKDLRKSGEKVKLEGKPATFYACWKYDDSVLEKVHVDKIERSGKEGRTLLLLIHNDSDYEMELNGQMRRMSDAGETLASANIFSPVVSPGETILQAFGAAEGEAGTFDYSLLARPSRFGNKSASWRMKTEDVSKGTGKLVVRVTNTSKEKVHLLDVQVLATQVGNSSGGFAYCAGEGYEKELAPGASTEVTFGDDNWGAQWSSLSCKYYFNGYAT